MTDSAARLAQLRAAYPDLHLDPAAIQKMRGQFNDVLIAADLLVFRFPRSPDAARTLAMETALLRALRGHLPLPIPDPTYVGVDPATGEQTFLGYAFLPGEPLERTRIAGLDAPAIQAIAAQLGAFLRALHAVPTAEMRQSGLDLPQADGPDDWRMLLADFRRELFPFMRADARTAVTAAFDAFLGDPASHAYTPVIRHGDFGGANIRFDPATNRVTGVIDFGSTAIGDAALDLASLSWYGEAFLAALVSEYPAFDQPSVRARAIFYRSTFALQQALWAHRTGDDADFADGIAAYV